ncbi:MAG: hypothetical protein V8S86_14250 [Eubacteriales bacterium]
MRQRISLLLAVLILAGTLSLPTLAAEPGEDNARETGAQNGGVQQARCPQNPRPTRRRPRIPGPTRRGQ